MYIPEVGQTNYEVPNKLDDKVKTEVEAQLLNWTNILMMPKYLTMSRSKELSNFYLAYLALAHDVLIRRMEKVAHQFAEVTVEAVLNDIWDNEGQ